MGELDPLVHNYYDLLSTNKKKIIRVI